MRFILFLFFIFSFQFEYAQSQFDFTISPVTPSLIGNDHMFLGFLTKLKTGKIIHIFRLDTGLLSSHVGNTGCIAERFSDDDGLTWSNPQVIYNDSCDDRVSSGGLLDNGDIVVFFGRANATGAWTATYLDYNLISSSDNGKTWSKRVTLSHVTGLQSAIFKIPSKKGYFSASYNHNYADLRYSSDGYNWDSVYSKWDYTNSQLYDLHEPTVSYIGDGKLIALFRQENKTLYQSVSSDFGLTWTEPSITSIANNKYCVALLNFYDDAIGKLITITTDRRGFNYGTSNKNSGIWIYCDNPETVFNNPLAYVDPLFKNRVLISSFRFLGYPVSTKLNDSTYLVIYSENKRKSDTLENANFYQFQIKLNKKLYIKRKTQTIQFDSIPFLYFNTLNYKLNSSSSSSLPVTYTTNDTLIAKIENGYLRIMGVGSFTIYAQQQGNDYFFPSEIKSQIVTVYKANQEIVFNDISDNFRINDTISVDATSGLPVNLSVSDTTVSCIKDGKILLIGKGKCDIIANQYGDCHFLNAPTVIKTIEIFDNNSSILVYPNPCKYLLYVDDVRDAIIEILTVSGEVILIDNTKVKNRVLNINVFNSGIYFIRITTNKKNVIIRKIVLND